MKGAVAMTTTTKRTSPMNSQYQPSLWNPSIVALPCMSVTAAPSFIVGFRSYHGIHPPDPC
jgi:hypothetical protein